MAKKNPNPIDVHVGGRVRLRRMLVGLSQEKLGEQLGLTFQQVQKYEKGSNRISASRLYEIGQILGVPVQFFFENMAEASADAAPGFAENGAADNFVMDFLSSSEGLQLNKAFASIGDPAVRRKLVELAKTIASDDGAKRDRVP